MCVASNPFQVIVSHASSLDLYYLAFPMDRKFTKCLVYGIYIVEFVQTMVFTHDAFATFGYGFGDLEALTGMYFNWFTVPIMSSVCMCSSFCSFSIAYHESSCLCRARLLCISNLHIVKVTNRPDIRHLCLFSTLFSVAVYLIFLQVSLTSFVAGIITGVWCFPADNVIELNSSRMSVAVGVSR